MMNFKKTFFNLSYRGVPPWDTGRPNPEIVSLEEAGWISGSVLDAGCGTGENALYLASRGYEVWGVDAAANAIRKAVKKAQERGISARFLRADALKLDRLGRTFDTVVDCGLFHTFSDRERERYTASLSTVLRQEGKLALWCFSDQGMGTIGVLGVGRIAAVSLEKPAEEMRYGVDQIARSRQPLCSAAVMYAASG